MKGFKTEISFNNKQRTLAYQHCGTGRHAWNWAVAYCNELSKNREKIPSAIDLHKLLVANVKSQNSWYYLSSKCTPQNKMRDLQEAWTRYFKELKNGKIEAKKKSYISKRKAKGHSINYDIVNEIGKPKFKKKNAANDTFYLEDSIQIDGKRIKIPKFGWIKTKEVLPQCNPKNVVVSRTADKWYISFKRELVIQPNQNKSFIGVDLGIKTLATLSDGTSFANPKAYSKHKRKLKLAQRKQNKKFVKGAKQQSSNYKKAANAVAKIHAKIARVRIDNIHKITTKLSKNHAYIVIEDLNVSGMSKNHKLASAILDGGFGEFRRQLDYKTKWYGSNLIVVDRFYPSSRTCNNCGHIKKDLSLKDRVYNCDICGHKVDRDLGAAINLEREGRELHDLKPVESVSSGLATTLSHSMKQETNSNQIPSV